MVLDHEGAPLIVGASMDKLGSWRVDGTPGPLSVGEIDIGRINALLAFEYQARR